MVKCTKCHIELKEGEVVKYGVQKYHAECVPTPRKGREKPIPMNDGIIPRKKTFDKGIANQSEQEVMDKLDEMDAYDEQERSPLNELWIIGKCHECNERKVVAKIIHRCFSCIRKSYIGITQGPKE